MPHEPFNYAVVEVAFFFGDPDFRALTCAQRCAYLGHWILAVERRCARLAPKIDCHYMASRCQVDARSVANMRAKCLANGLLRQLPDGSILVVGVEDKHRSLKWTPWQEEGCGRDGRPPPTEPTEPNVKKPTEPKGGSGESSSPSSIGSVGSGEPAAAQATRVGMHLGIASRDKAQRAKDERDILAAVHAARNGKAGDMEAAVVSITAEARRLERASGIDNRMAAWVKHCQSLGLLQKGKRR